MDWSKRINLAIEFIEDNLDEEIAIEDVAQVACSSRFHFHRMFYSSFNVTPADYIRKRKLTKAAADLVSGKERVIDIAARYGYDSPNAFTRAFRNLHGLNPSQARSSKVKLSAFQRVSFQTETKGTVMLDYKIIERPSFEIVGKSKVFEFDQFVKEGSKFWKAFVKSKEYNSLFELNNGRSGAISGAPIMSVYVPKETGERNVFTDLLAIEKTPELNLKGFDTYSVPKATYAEFNCTYQTSMKTNRFIYGEWFASTGYERDGNKPDIAAYFPIAFRPLKDTAIRWWIPVKKN